MKNFTMKASALAIAAAIPGYAAAAINLGSAVGVPIYAAELNYNSAALGTPIAATAKINTPLGFGVSAGQNRYARFVLSSNANFNAAMAAGSFVDLTTANNSGFSGFSTSLANTDGVTVVSGGTAGSKCVVYQVTGFVGVGNTAQDVLEWSTPAINVTNGSPVTATYTLHETASSASCSTGSDNALLSAAVTGPIITLAPSLAFSGVNGTTATADVTTLYTKETTASSAGSGGTNLAVLQLGTLTADIIANNNAADVPVLQAQLITGASIKVTGDFSSTGTTPLGTVTLSSAACDTPVLVDTAVVAADKQSATFSSAAVLALWADASAAIGSFVCYNTNGVTPIQASGYTAAVTFAPAAGATLTPIATQPAGTVERDGTILKAPFISGAAGVQTYIQLANTGSLAAPYTLRCFAPSGAATVGIGGSVSAGNTSRLFMNNLGCGAGSNAIEITLAVPAGNVNGALVRVNNTTGDSALDSLTGNQ